MASVAIAAGADSAARLPGPRELLPGRPDAVVDLQTDDGAALVGARWRYAEARVEEIEFVEVGGPDAADPLGPGDQALQGRIARLLGQERLGLAEPSLGLAPLDNLRAAEDDDRRAYVVLAQRQLRLQEFEL